MGGECIREAVGYGEEVAGECNGITIYFDDTSRLNPGIRTQPAWTSSCIILRMAGAEGGESRWARDCRPTGGGRIGIFIRGVVFGAVELADFVGGGEHVPEARR